MIKKFYDKNELAFSIIWIIAYCVLASAFVKQMLLHQKCYIIFQ